MTYRCEVRQPPFKGGPVPFHRLERPRLASLIMITHLTQWPFAGYRMWREGAIDAAMPGKVSIVSMKRHQT